jgi:flagellum-specific peptidoglycan hydrolase FlgJ
VKNKELDLFPDDIVLAAQKSEKATGCPACITLAQWALESGYGKHLSGRNNPFGIKWTTTWKDGYTLCKTREFIRGEWVTVNAKFANFPTLEAAFSRHGNLLMNPKGPYKQGVKAWEASKDWHIFLKLIAPVYATDPKYFDKVFGIIKQWQLDKLNLK